MIGDVRAEISTGAREQPKTASNRLAADARTGSSNYRRLPAVVMGETELTREVARNGDVGKERPAAADRHPVPPVARQLDRPCYVENALRVCRPPAHGCID